MLSDDQVNLFSVLGVDPPSPADPPPADPPADPPAADPPADPPPADPPAADPPAADPSPPAPPPSDPPASDPSPPADPPAADPSPPAPPPGDPPPGDPPPSDPSPADPPPASPSLLDRLDSTVSGLVSDAAGALSNAGQAIAGIAADLPNVGASLLDDMGANVGFNSGASLPSPSYVNNPNTPSALQGGGTASAGDSSFVTGAQKSTLMGKVSALKDAAGKIADAESAIEKAAQNATEEDKAKGVGKHMVDSVKNLKAVADSLLSLAQAIEKLVPGDNDDALDAASKASSAGDRLITAVDTVLKMREVNGKLDAFKSNPTYDNAQAWALGVAGAFDAAAALVPSEGLPKFMVDYWKGLLSAPRAYIQAFIQLQKVYFDKVDAEAGLSRGYWYGHGATQRVSDGSWEGDLTPIYHAGCFQPADRNGDHLDGWMSKHRTIDGVDLWNTDVATGKALLVKAIRDTMGGDEDADVRSAWISYISGF